MDELDRDISDRTDRGCLYVLLGVLAVVLAGIVIAWLYAKSLGL